MENYKSGLTTEDAKLCRAIYDTVCDVFKLEIDGENGVPAMIGPLPFFTYANGFSD